MDLLMVGRNVWVFVGEAVVKINDWAVRARGRENGRQEFSRRSHHPELLTAEGEEVLI
jgi:hypothetical protein